MEPVEPVEIQPLPASPPAAAPRLWNWKDMLWMGGSILLLLGLGLVAAQVGLRRLLPAGLPKDQQNIIVVVVALVLEAAAIFLAVYLFGVRRRGLSLAEIGFRLPDPWWLLAGAVLGVLALPAAGLLGLVVRLALHLNPQNPQTQVLVPKEFSWPAFLAVLLLGGVVVPVAEELFFRGVLFRWLRGSLRFWPAAVLSGLVFGIAHGEVSIAVATAALGVVLAWVMERSRSLWPGILIHAINNSASITLLYLALLLNKSLLGL